MKNSMTIVFLLLSMNIFASSDFSPIACDAIKAGINLLDSGANVDNDLAFCASVVNDCDKNLKILKIEKNSALVSLGNSCDCFVELKVSQEAEVYGEVTSCL